jgi:DNA-binding IclR family transcriptional regulator
MTMQPPDSARDESIRVGRVQSVMRALAIVDMVAASTTPMRAKEIADGMNLHLATTSHLLSSLVQMGYLERDKRAYTLGRHKILDLAGKVEADWSPSPSQLRLLHDVVVRTGETAYISTLRRDSVSIDAVVDGTHTVRVAGLSAGWVGHVHTRASGKVLLAFSSATRRGAILLTNGGLHPRTSNTITDPDALVRELETTRVRGYAVDREEFALGIGGLAVPLFEGAQPLRRTLSISAPIHRFDDAETFELYLTTLLNAAAFS